ncbi:sigma 54-interacting transcriptional regulator [Pseudogracilibacillus sp. SE30717A]|uniref:sigma-54 interaction domain-containing protein n=1 Tax=Pseudogracilibacillus sp. SE30717A TaxID=3098293 RepID=UPI00300E23A5
MNTSQSYTFFHYHSIEEYMEWLQSILMSIHDGVLVIDKEGIVRLINPEYTRITGVAPEKIIGKRLKDVRPQAQLVDVLNDGKERVGIYRKEGNVEYVVDMAPILNQKEIIGAVSVCKGLTEVHKLVRQLKEDRDQLQNQIGSIHQAKYTFDEIIGADGGLTEVIRIGKKAAVSELPILISGESGTGKELFAQSIHNESKRANGPFIPVNCATIPASLIESELFGYEEGSFTNSKKGGKVGLFEMANGGTIFLDEIGELSQELQAKFLRVLEEQTIRKIGGTVEKSINVRVLAATNRDLSQLIQKGMFREDLYYRLNVLKIAIPPLRDRREDIPKIIHSILEKHSRGKESYSISEETLCKLQTLKWPGNVRELINTIKYAVCMTDTRQITEKHLPEIISENKTMNESNVNFTLKEVTERAEYEQLKLILKEYGNSLEEKKEIASRLGVSVATLYNKLNKYDLSF